MSVKTLVAIGVAVLVLGIAAILASGGDEGDVTADPIDDVPGVEYWQNEEPSDGTDREPVDTAVEESEETARVDLEPAARGDLELPSGPAGRLAPDAEPSPSLGWRRQDAEPAAEPPYAAIAPDEPVEPDLEADETLEPEADEALEPEADEALEPETDEAPNPEELYDPSDDAYEPEEPAQEVPDDYAGAEDDVEPAEPYEDEQPLEPDELESPDEPVPEQGP